MRVTAKVRIPQERQTKDPCEMPPADNVEIREADDGYYLILYGENGEFGGDDWFGDLSECKNQARTSFGIEEQDWVTDSEDPA